MTIRLLLVLSLICACAAPPGRRPRTVPPDHTGPYTTWWSDERVKEQGSYRLGQRHGSVQAFHPDGSLAMQGEFEAGVPMGRIEHYHPGGDDDLSLVEIFRDGLRDGTQTEYWPGGRKRGELVFEAGRREGAERRWSERGAVLLEGRWGDDLQAGRWLHRGASGRLEREEFFWNAGGERVGYLENVYDATGRVPVQTLKRLTDGHWQGWVSLWHENGGQAGCVEYQDGRRHGRDVAWSPTGRKLSEGRREQDLRTGLWTFWNEAGEVVDRREYREGYEVVPATDGGT